MHLIKKHINSEIKTQFITLITISALIITGLYFMYRQNFIDEVLFHDFYQKNLRGYLFSGFISVGSFLLSLHTFVIVNLKDKLFSTEEYKKIYANSIGVEVCKIKENLLYKPLDNLSCFINISIWLSITTAISQFTIGLANCNAASLACTWMAVLTVLFMLNCLIIIRENIKIMLKQ